MRIRATIQRADGKIRASCLDMEAAGEGATREEALAALREAVHGRLSPEAVAPPEHPSPPAFEIVIVEGRPPGPSEER
jgi:hypothetical protein